ncbi:polysaccharide biosynthesis C-terminal domain-containing protein [Sulfurospirillum sp. 1612]|uniref:polysaccharide biosynthesis C-terminal domain-containing protein n=1 Tax=Sulfurospirillum sp. 1612 TaxID=3094835 RepID=UPI002F946E0F
MPKINKSFLITMFTVGVPLLMQLFFIRYVSYNVDKDIYGNFILLQTLIVALSYIFLQIPSQAYNRFYNSATDKVEFVNEFRTLLIFINIISIFIIYIYGLFMERFSYEILTLIFIYFLILNNYTFNQQIFLLNLERKKYFILKTLEASSKFLLPILFYISFQSLESFLYGIVCGYIFSFMFIQRYLKDYKFSFIINLENLKKYFIFAYPIVFVAIFSWGISFSDRYFIDYYMTSKDVALYAILAQVAGMGQVIGQVYSMYVNPKVLKYYEEDKTIALNYLKKSIIILSIIFAFLGLVAYLLPTSIYELLLEPEVINNSYYFNAFIILVFAIFFTLIQTALSMYLTLFKKLNVLAYIYVAAFIVNIIGNFFIQEYGIIAASISTFLAYLVILLLQLIYIRKYRDE